MKDYKLDSNSKGLTILELLVAVTITVIVLAAAGAIFTAQHRSYVKSSKIKEMQENIRDAIEIIREDIVMAGFGTDDKKLAFFFKDGGNNAPDKIYISDWRFISEFELLNDIYSDTKITGINGNNVAIERLDLDNCQGCFDNCYGDSCNYDCSNIGTGNCSGSEFSGSIYQYIITNSTDPNKKVGRIISIDSNVLRLDTAVDGGLVTPAIYYCVDTGENSDCHPSSSAESFVLRRSDRSSGGRQPLINGIVDLQIAYRDKDGNWYCDKNCNDTSCCPMSPFDPTKIDLIRINLVARTDKEDLGWTSKRPSVENREGGSAPDGYFYRVYTVEVKPRNIGF